jgi:hypothetical protein
MEPYIPMAVPSFGERRVSAFLIGYDPAFAEKQGCPWAPVRNKITHVYLSPKNH